MSNIGRLQAIPIDIHVASTLDDKVFLVNIPIGEEGTAKLGYKVHVFSCIENVLLGQWAGAPYVVREVPYKPELE
jgi:hypothetical protein